MAITNLDYKKPVVTRQQHTVQIYHVYQDYMNGAWYNEEKDRWVPIQWTLSGYFLPNLIGHRGPSDLDLINYDPV